MTRIVYIGMDVHKDIYSLCSFDSHENYMFSEITVKAETVQVLAYIKNIEHRFKDDDVSVVCGYEAGPTGFSLCRDLQKKDISCVIISGSKNDNGSHTIFAEKSNESFILKCSTLAPSEIHPTLEKRLVETETLFFPAIVKLLYPILKQTGNFKRGVPIAEFIK